MIKVLVVDDSVVFRTQISAALSKNPQIEIVGTAANGSIALQKLKQLSVDVVTLDMEMPEMNGIDVLKAIRQEGISVRVILFSSQTQRGAESALLALKHGADDVVAKPTGDHLNIETAGLAIEQALVPKVLQFANMKVAGSTAPVTIDLDRLSVPTSPLRSAATTSRRDLSSMNPKGIVIGCSTGGPTALERIFSSIAGPIAVPIFIVQHMPPVFTEILAKRIGDICGIPAGEAKDGQIVESNRIYVAPGDFHMLLEVEKSKKQLMLRLNQSPQRNSVRPAVDHLFESAAQIWGRDCLAIVLTGMGEDGLAGVRALREQGAGILIQDKESCVVFGMPGAIYEADLYDEIGNLDKISGLLRRLAQGRERIS